MPRAAVASVLVLLSNDVSSGRDPSSDAKCASADTLLLQASSSRWRSGASTDNPYDKLAAWVAGPYGDCVRSCSVSTRSRSVECRSFFEDLSLPASACAAWPKPQEQQHCTCGLFPCIDKDCNSPSSALFIESEEAEAQVSFSFIGCRAADADAASSPEKSKQVGSTPMYDTGCLGWAGEGPCKSGLPFYNVESAASPELCHSFCMGKGLDVFGLVHGSTCRCGASRLNHAVWHDGRQHPDLVLSHEDVIESESAALCSTSIFRHMGHYVAGGIPFEQTDTKLQDVAYIDSIVAGRIVWEETEEDGTPGGFGRRLGRRWGQRSVDDALTVAEPTLMGMTPEKGPPQQHRAPHSLERPSWARHCWPGRCGPGGGPWMERWDSPPPGVEHIWESYAIVRYCFDGKVDGKRREAWRRAVEIWRSTTCVNLLEEADTPTKPHVLVAVDDSESCYAWSIGYPGDHAYTIVNMGWCNSLRYVGNVVHEIGHILGMNHEQKRADAVQMHRGHGPHLLMHWENVPYKWAVQYQQDPSSYMGSMKDGPLDPHSGYAPYDFESIMQYPPNGRFETVPPEAKDKTGQRHHLSILDIAQILDTYQCRRRGH